jgi:hypothetical protein
LSRKVRETRSSSSRKRPERGQEVLAARWSGFPLYCVRLGSGRARQFLKLRRSPLRGWGKHR